MSEQRGKKPASGINITGNVNTGGGDIASGDIQKGNVYQSHGLQAADLNELFSPIFDKIDQKSELSPEDKGDLKDTVEEIRGEVAKGAEANEKVIGKHLRNVARMAPDILEVTLKTIANPVLGLATLAQKIANKASNERPEGGDVEKKNTH